MQIPADDYVQHSVYVAYNVIWFDLKLLETHCDWAPASS